MARSQRSVSWFRRFVWVGILINIAFAVPALVAPTVLMNVLGVGPGLLSPGAIWLRNAGMLLILLSVFYALAAQDPLESRSLARRTVYVRWIAAAFWLWMLLVVRVSAVFWWFFATDLILGLIQGVFLMRAFADHPRAARQPWQRGRFSRVYAAVFRLINRKIAWHRLPTIIATPNLGALREDLRAQNLYDTPEPVAKCPHWHPSYRENRSPDGTFNDLADPTMGAAGDRFGRNMPLEDCWPESEEARREPSPREISRRLLARDTFKPATILNLLAAAWIQFQNHEWFNHRLCNDGGDSATDCPEFFDTIALQPDDDWVTAEQPRVMRVRRTATDPTRPPGAGYPPTFQSTESQWWDGSQLYGSTQALQAQLRSGTRGHLNLVSGQVGGEACDLLPEDPAHPGIDLTGFSQNWWIGMTLLHTLFAKEHNRICDGLGQRYPGKDDEWLYQKAKLINSALMAKIHTLEWTPGILQHPALKVSMNANWWGILGEWIKRRCGRLSDSEALSGIVGSPTEHHAAPHSLLTEEFVAVYRLHPLIPDEITFQSLSDPRRRETVSFDAVQGRSTRTAMLRLGTMGDLFYTFGREHPGAITLRNFPNTLRNHTRANGDRLDLAAVDIYRDRERGVPRYNRFRELLRMPRVATFEEMTGRTSDDAVVTTLKDLYGHPDRVDLMVGLFAEPAPRGFGFSDTAFRIFILMASRRLKSDRFFTVDYRPEVYTEFGLEWIADNTMLDVLKRHHPELQPALQGVTNAFAPWTALG